MAESSVSSEDGDAKVTRPFYSTKPSPYFWDTRIKRFLIKSIFVFDYDTNQFFFVTNWN